MIDPQKIKNILNQEFFPVYLDIQDESQKHAGHREAQKSGGGHYDLVIVSDKFKDKSLLERHKLIYKTLEKELMKDIHALAIKAYTCQEYTALSS